MRQLPFFAAILSVCTSFSFAFSQSLNYEIQPVFREKQLTLAVKLRFSGEADGETDLLLPSNLANAQKLHRSIRNLKLVSPNGHSKMDADSLFVHLEYSPGREIVVNYEIVQDFSGNEITPENAFRPILQLPYFHVFGSSLFLMPSGNQDFEVSIFWKNFPSGWNLQNSFGSQQTRQNFKVNSLSWLESVFVGGDFRILKTEVRKSPVFLAIRGSDWSFSDAEILELLRQTVEVQRTFWQDFEIPYFSVTLVPFKISTADGGRETADGHQFSQIGYVGSGLQNSFATFATPGKSFKIKELHPLFHHEMMHDWVGVKIRNGGKINDMGLGWFSEGFTEYFAWKNMLAAGLISVDEFLAAANRDFFQKHYTSPLAEAPNFEIEKNFFNRSDVSDLPYKRGYIFAFYLDNVIKIRSAGQHNLHDFMKELLDHFYENDLTLVDDFDFFTSNLGKFLGDPQFLEFYKKHILEGKLIAPDEFVLPVFLKMEVENGVPVLKKSGAATDLELKNWLEK